jgi:N-acyl-D-amino-acid deacylase
MKIKLHMFSFAYLWLLIGLLSGCKEQHFDILIQNGTIIDGTGKPRYIADVGIVNGKIVEIGNFFNATAPQIIDAKGMMVAPGFIDVHTHIEGNLQEHPLAENFLYDGVTSVITGNCGGSAKYLDSFFIDLKKIGVSLNVGTLYGHNTVRNAVMGNVNRAPKPKELEKMRQLTAKAMKDGAVGLSTGLIYIPGVFAKTDEIVALAKVVKEYGGVYTSHIRNEDYRVFDAIDEAVTIGRESGAPVEISHLKITGKSSWGKSAQIIEKLNAYRAQGIDVMADQYPYTASSTILDTQLPDWAKGGGKDSLRIRLKNKVTRDTIIREMKKMLAATGFDEYTWAVVSGCPWNPSLNGKNIPEVTKVLGYPSDVDGQIATILDITTRKQTTYMIYHKMNEVDIRQIMAYPYCMVASDAGVAVFGSGLPHPRAYGTNTRVLGDYVRNQQVITLEDAVRKMTQLPATRFGLKGRGELGPGMAADIVIFDPATVGDKATFDKPHAYPTGIKRVMVNGVTVINNGKHTGKRPGQMLKHEVETSLKK